MNFKSSKDLII